MIKFVATDFLDQIAPDCFWSTGSEGAYIACTIELDDKSVLLFRVDKPNANDVCRIYARPLTESDETVRRAVDEAWPRIAALLQKRGARGISFRSASLETVELMSKYGFAPVGGEDYRLNLSEGN